MVFLRFYSGFGDQELCKNHEKLEKPPFSNYLSKSRMVFLFFYSGFGGLSWFLVVFLGFYSGFLLATVVLVV